MVCVFVLGYSVRCVLWCVFLFWDILCVVSYGVCFCSGIFCALYPMVCVFVLRYSVRCVLWCVFLFWDILCVVSYGVCFCSEIFCALCPMVCVFVLGYSVRCVLWYSTFHVLGRSMFSVLGCYSGILTKTNKPN